MLGNEITGSANKYASKGPLAIPKPKNILAIGTSTRVGKYMNTPNKTAERFDIIVLLPTYLARNFSGKTAVSIPAMNTPTKSNGNIVLKNL